MRLAGVVPPIMLFVAPRVIAIPPAFATMKLPSILLSCAAVPEIKMPHANPLIANPFMMQLSVRMFRPLTLAPPPSISTIGCPVKPGWLVASIITDSVIVGNALSGWMVYGPPGMLKLIVSGPAVLFAVPMASRKEPGPLSLVLLTII